MPYQNNSQLPEKVKDNLPEDAQDIWREAYNSAKEQYKDQDDTEETAARVAWSAVKEEYEKNDEGEWVAKD